VIVFHLFGRSSTSAGSLHVLQRAGNAATASPPWHTNAYVPRHGPAATAAVGRRRRDEKSRRFEVRRTFLSVISELRVGPRFDQHDAPL